MAKKNKSLSGKQIKYIQIFVEGQTDEALFKALLQYYEQNSTTPMNPRSIYNLKGVNRYSSKLESKLKNDICPAVKKKGYSLHAVCCSYDMDVFEFAEQPTVDWKKVKDKVKNLDIPHFNEIKVRNMIEDWLLDDIGGLCKYLRIKPPIRPSGKTGFDKIQALFKLANKTYKKGTNCQDYIKFLDIEVIRNARKKELSQLEKFLNVTI